MQNLIVIELHLKKKNKMKNMAKCEKHFLRYCAYLTSQINQFLFHGYFHTFFTLISLKVKLTLN